MLKPVLLLSAAAAIGAATTSPAIAAETKASANAEFLAKNYPPESLKRGEQGRVGFQLSFEADGSLTGCTVTQSSGFKALDSGTCDMLAQSAKIEPPRDAEGRRVSTVRTGYIDWTLPANAVKLADAGSVRPRSATDPLICKRTTKPGSIVKRIKRCMSKSEWAIHERLTREEVRRAMDTNICSDHGC